ncbi:FAD-binding oxidoreductase [Rhodobacteraceae bacterium NNCM2]|nr:FAD-binding oxidoreductase [Coraliihabitans acroporae]
MKTTPFWHEAAPPEEPSHIAAPETLDVAIVGAGFTGLNAAKTLAEAGRNVAVFEKGPPGAGASTRNGGMIGWGHRASIANMTAKYGEEQGKAILAEARLSLDYTTALIESLEGETRYKQVGRFLAAGSPRHFDSLVTWAKTEAPLLGMEVDIVPKGEQQAYIGSDLYHGGVYFRQHGALHPALFHKALLEATRAAGAQVIDHCPVTRVSGGPGDWVITHEKGTTRAAELIYAGNGYTGGGKGPFGPMARRLMPIPSYIIATETLGANRMATLFPKGNNVVETRSFHSYFRPDPWGERVLYGGRASLNVIDEAVSARRLRDVMLSVFPDLGDVQLTHSWRGFVAFTFDGAPHVGQADGVWYACGYNGSGVAMAPYLGWRLAQKILGTDQGTTGFDPTPFKEQPLYGGNPWFLSVVEAWMKIKDRMEGVQRVRRH